MQRLPVLLAVSLALLGLPGCKKKPPPESSGSGSAVAPITGSGSAAPTTPPPTTGSGSGSAGSAAATLPGGDKVLGSSVQATLTTQVAKDTAERKAYVVKGAKDAFTIDLETGPTDAEVPKLSEFPIMAPGNKNLNTTNIQLLAPNGASMMLSITTLDPMFKAGEGTPELLKKLFDSMRDRAIKDGGATLTKEGDVTIANAQGRVIDLTQEVDGKKTNLRLWMLFLAKPNLMVSATVTAPENDPLYARAEAMLKTLAIP